MTGKIVVLSVLLAGAPALISAAEAKKEAVAQKKKVKKGKKHAHEHPDGAWVCKWHNVPPPGHACTFRSKKGGKCEWCGSEMVREEDLKK